MFSSVVENDSGKAPLGTAVLKAFNQESAEKGVLVSCQIDYKDLQLGKELGRGSFGIVYKGTYKFAPVAIKQLQIDSLSFEAQEEFQKEAETMAQLHYPNIVHFYGYCSVPRCLVMEYMPKGSLFSVLQDKTQALVDWNIRIRIAVDMVSGLAFLHSKAILHRDIKSLNVLLDGENKAKLTDFGLSRVKNETKSQTSLNRKDAVGTLPWMAPELFKRKAVYTQKSNIYSLGMTFWELASRKIPYIEDSQEAISTFVREGEREDIPKDCPQKFAYLIQQCWAGSSEARPTASNIAKFITTDAKTLEETSSKNPVLDSSFSPEVHLSPNASPVSPIAAQAVRRGSEKLNLTDKKEEQEKTRYVLETLRTFFIEERDEGEKTENYAIYNEYLKKANNGAQLAYKAKQNKHVLCVNGTPLRYRRCG